MAPIISYAQNFEDVMLWRALGHVENGFYIDVGAQHPIEDSVSRAFYENGWRGIHVEPTQFYANLLRENRPDETVLQTAISTEAGVMKFFEIPGTGISTGDPAIAKQHQERGFPVHETKVSCITLASVFKSCAGKEIHWLKIDVEGMEKQVLESWKPARDRPWIVVVESTLPLTKTESHQAWEPLLIKYGYSSVYFDGLNRYYASETRPELKDSFRSGPNVFDGFVFNGTGSVAFWSLVEERYKTQLADTVSDLSAIRVAKDEEIAGISKLVERREQEFHAKTDALVERTRQIEEDWRHSLKQSDTLSNELSARMAETIRISQLLVSREQEFARSLAEQQAKTSLLKDEYGALQGVVASLKNDLQTERVRSERYYRELSELQIESSHIVRAGDLLSVQLAAQIELATTLQETVADLKQRLEHLQASWSWRFTAPLRWASNFFLPEEKRIVSAPTIEAISPNLQSHTHPILAGHAMPPTEQIATSGIPPASSLAELTARHDKEFINCAYQTLLKREPDSQGFAVFLSRLRRGDSKVQILSDIRWSAEGKACAAQLPGLEAAESRRRLAAKPFIGGLFRFLYAEQHDGEAERALRRMENQLFVMNEQFHERFNQVEMTLARRSTAPQPVATQQTAAFPATSAETDPHVLEVLSELKSALTSAKKASDENRN